MFEVLLSLCLATEPGTCRTERHPGGVTMTACRAEAARLAAAASDPAQSWPCVPEGGTPAFPLTEIAPGVLVYKGAHAESAPGNLGAIANLGVVIGETSVAVIDAGGSRAVGEALLAAIRAETDLPVSHLILTHMHPDHVLGAAVFAEQGARVVGHRRLPRALAARAGAYLEAGRRLVGPAFEGTSVPDAIDEAPEEIDLGGRRLIVEQHPTAHTDNDLSVFDRATGTWFLGDLLFVDHLPVLDGSLTGWIALIETLTAREAARVVPGHGPAALPWPEAAAPLGAYLDMLATATRDAIAEGRPMLEAIRTIEPWHGNMWLLVPLFHPRNASAAYQELEWE